MFCLPKSKYVQLCFYFLQQFIFFTQLQFQLLDQILKEGFSLTSLISSTFLDLSSEAFGTSEGISKDEQLTLSNIELLLNDMRRRNTLKIPLFGDFPLKSHEIIAASLFTIFQSFLLILSQFFLKVQFLVDGLRELPFQQLDSFTYLLVILEEPQILSFCQLAFAFELQPLRFLLRTLFEGQRLFIGSIFEEAFALDGCSFSFNGLIQYFHQFLFLGRIFLGVDAGL